MAVEILRTAADDAHDALWALALAEQEITHLRAHLERLQAGGELPVALQARRSAGIVGSLVADAVNRTKDAVCHADLPTDLPADALPI